MKKIKILSLLTIFLLMPCIVYGASISGGTIYKVGDFVDIIFYFGTNVAAYDSLSVSYDATSLQYISGDPLNETLWWDSSQASQGIRLKSYRFKALKNGTTNIRVNVIGAVSANYNMDRLGNLTANKTIIIGGSTIKGDLNKDGLVNTTDAAIIMTMYKNNSASLESTAIGDMDGDGSLTALDAAMILTIYKMN